MARGGRRKSANLPGPSAGSTRNDGAVSMREEKTGKSSNQKWSNKNGNKGLSVKATDMLRIEHLEFCAGWAVGDAAIPSLAAFYGHRLALARESAGSAPNNALFQCQRCETILRRDINCTVRPKKNKVKSLQISGETRCKPTPNFVVYKCHFCSYGNLKKENTRRRVKDTCPSNPSTATKSTLETPAIDDHAIKISASEKVKAGKIEVNTPSESALTKNLAKPVLIGEDVKATCSSNPSTAPKSTLETPAIDDPAIKISASEKVSAGEIEVNIPKELALTKSLAKPVLIDKDVKETSCSELNSPKPVGIEETDQEKVMCHSEIASKPVLWSEEVNQEKDGVNLPDKAVIPAPKPRLTLLDSNKKKRKKPTAKKPSGPENSGDEAKSVGKSKRKRKQWTSLKEIADSNEQAKKRALFISPVPFSL